MVADNPTSSPEFIRQHRQGTLFVGIEISPTNAVHHAPRLFPNLAALIEPEKLRAYYKSFGMGYECNWGFRLFGDQYRRRAARKTIGRNTAIAATNNITLTAVR
jgi:hypothetical protein